MVTDWQYLQKLLKTCQFQVHSEVGKTCLGAKVNHKVVPLNTKLNNGDTIEVITSSSQSPNYGWLKFAITSKARNQIKRYLNKQEREESVKMGEEILTKSLRRLKMLNQLDEVRVLIQNLALVVKASWLKR